MLSWVRLGALAACFLSAPMLRAQDGKVAAVQAYDEAEALMAQGRVSDACPRYAESQKLDPQLGTLLHLADCLERNGQTASAWATFREAAELAEKRGDARQELAKDRVAGLTPRLSRLKIIVGVTPGVQVERDAVSVGQPLWGTALPTDPGSHVITASAPGRQPWKATVEVNADGSTVVIEVPVLTPTGAPQTTELTVAPTPSAPHTQQTTDSRPTAHAPRWPAVLAAGLGVVGVGVGSIFGLRSMSKKDLASEHCSGNVCRDQEGPRLRQDAIDAGNVSTAAFVVGGIGLATGAVLWFALPASSKHHAQRAPTVRVGLGSQVALEGQW